MDKITHADISDPDEAIERATALSLEFGVPAAAARQSRSLAGSCRT